MVSAEKVTRVREVLRMIQADVEADALKLDGLVFDGRHVGPLFGEIYATLGALAKAVEVLYEQLPTSATGELDSPPVPSSSRVSSGEETTDG